MTAAGIPPPDYLRDNIVVMPVLYGQGTKNKFKRTPPDEFYAIIHWLHLRQWLPEIQWNLPSHGPKRFTRAAQVEVRSRFDVAVARDPRTT